jgi:FkbM family methyltransferase
VVDVGAHAGEFTRSLAQAFGVARGILVEPQLNLASRLRREFPNPTYQVCEVALSDQPGEMELEVWEGAPAVSSLLHIRHELPDLGHVRLGERVQLPCRVETLDTLAKAVSLAAIDVLKVDVQGNDLRVLQGGVHILARTAVVFVELSFRQLYDGSCLFQEVVDYLRGHELLLRDLLPEFFSPSGELLQVNGLFTRSAP